MDLRKVRERVWYCNGLFPTADHKHMYDTRGRQVETVLYSPCRHREVRRSSLLYLHKPLIPRYLLGTKRIIWLRGRAYSFIAEIQCEGKSLVYLPPPTPLPPVSLLGARLTPLPVDPTMLQSEIQLHRPEIAYLSLVSIISFIHDLAPPAPPPLPYCPVSKLDQRNTGKLRKRDNLFTGERGGEGGRSQIIRRPRKTGPL